MTGRCVVVGVCGGIAAYKTATLVSRLVQGGHEVWVVMTPSAIRFVGETTFAALSAHAPVIDAWDSRFPLGPHIELAERANLLVIAPATARIIASCAHGLADDLLATLYLHRECPVLMAPAMSAPMWAKPAVQRNVDQLSRDGVQWIGPESGWLSCRREGLGRLAEAEQMFEAVQALLPTP
jgi:phosphopantothenoylcysteine decarboxylase/phosphopantothenate--cysteine ligase